jgi:predicted metallopeptidase
MPNEALQWEQVKEAEGKIEKLINNYPDKFGHIQANQVAVVQVVNKERPKGAKWFAKIEGIKAPISLFCEKRYIVYFFKSTWDDFNEAQRSWILTEMLYHIPATDGGEPDGSILPDDFKGMRELVKRFGVDPLSDPNLPDLAKEKQVF